MAESTIDDADSRPLADAIRRLRACGEDLVKSKSLHDGESLLQALQHVRRLLTSAPPAAPVQDNFRAADGFEVLADILDGLSIVHGTPESCEMQLFISLVLECFQIIDAAIRGSPRNRLRLSQSKDGRGWDILERLLLAAFVPSPSPPQVQVGDVDRIAVIYGLLFAIALEIEPMSNPFCPGEQPDTDQRESVLSPTGLCVDLPSEITKTFRAVTPGPNIVWNARALQLILALWIGLQPISISSPGRVSQFNTAALSCLLDIAGSSLSNALLMHRTTLFDNALTYILSDNTRASTQPLLKDLLIRLSRFGMKNLHNAANLFRAAEVHEEAASLLQEALKISSEPSYCHFDLTSSGYASLEYADMHGMFPPQEPHDGYTICLWIRVEKFERECHTTLFGAFDASQTCFILVYIEKKSKQLVLQPSLSKDRPSVRFRRAVFEENVWYHIALTHKRPVDDNSSSTKLHLNGRFIEELNCHYPKFAPSDKRRPVSGDSSADRPQSVAIETFFGTPRDLSPRLGQGLVSSRWSLASAHLFRNVLHSDLITVYQKLGPTYLGNFQDCLGSFQTYGASAALSIQDQKSVLSRTTQSIINRAIRTQAADLNPERDLLLNVIPPAIASTSSVPSSSSQYPLWQQARQPGSNTVAATVTQLSSKSGNHTWQIIGKGKKSHMLVSNCLVHTSLSLEDCSLRLGGCGPLGLHLVESASNSNSLIRNLAIFFTLVQNNWRNSEAVERDNSFGMLSLILRDKVKSLTLGVPAVNSAVRSVSPVDNSLNGNLSSDILIACLDFTGIDRKNPERSLLVNSLAYRMLIVDCEIWRTSDAQTQVQFFNQYVTFAKTSRYRLFNMQRLSKMRIIKKLLDMMKAGDVRAEATIALGRALGALLACSNTGDNYRSAALYIVYALYASFVPPVHSDALKLDSLDPGLNNKRRNNTIVGASTDQPPAVEFSKNRVASQPELGLLVLETFERIFDADHHHTHILDFARAVSIKWLFYLFTSGHRAVVVTAMSLLTRLLVNGGPSYLLKFEDKWHGFIVLTNCLRNWWKEEKVWLYCFAILLGDQSILPKKLDENSISTNLLNHDVTTTKIYSPTAWEVIGSLLTYGILDGTKSMRSNVYSGYSCDFNHQADSSGAHDFAKEDPIEVVIDTVKRFLGESVVFADFVTRSNSVTCLLNILYTVLSSSADDEALLSKREVDPLSLPPDNESVSNIQSFTDRKKLSQEQRQKHGGSEQGSHSFEIVTSQDYSSSMIPSLLLPLRPPTCIAVSSVLEHPYCIRIIDLLALIFARKIIHAREFTGIGIFLKGPAATLSDQALINSKILTATLMTLCELTDSSPGLLLEPSVLNNVQKFFIHVSEAMFEGWYYGHSNHLLQTIACLYNHTQLPEMRNQKAIRLCSPILFSYQDIFRRVVIFQLTQLISSNKSLANDQFFIDLLRWQTLLLPESDDDDPLIGPLCYLLYGAFFNAVGPVKDLVLRLWQAIAVSRPDDVWLALTARHDRELNLQMGFFEYVREDLRKLHVFLEDNKFQLGDKLREIGGAALRKIVTEQNICVKKSASTRLMKRSELVQGRVQADEWKGKVWNEHSTEAKIGIQNIYEAELSKQLRTKQDFQDNVEFLQAAFSKTKRKLHKLEIFQQQRAEPKWSLSETESHNRMRLRLIPIDENEPPAYRPKRKTMSASVASDNLTTRSESLLKIIPGSSQPLITSKATSELAITDDDLIDSPAHIDPTSANGSGDGFEIIANPSADDEVSEDKNRRVLRSLQKGEIILNVHNVSRLNGLEAFEGLLIVGQNALYLIDGLFLRSDGEVVNFWEAPQTECDPYTRIISGRDDTPRTLPSPHTGTDIRHWPWADIVNMFQRRFLFRDVGMEIFFKDGRSYLLTAASMPKRDEIFREISAKTRNSSTDMKLEQRQLSLLPAMSRAGSFSVGARLASAFVSNIPSTATKQWAKGEMTNFEYLMYVNTLAGRTFNDLTQYPVFPWVLADYTSTDLDLNDPNVYRDLSKPMGCQNPEREAAFRERFQSLSDMLDENTPPFHYGTHYSSAMIVTSYLIRLQPFVRAYLLLQGGAFDHPERMFYSIEKAWLSASRETMSDVRELTPEFFYLPDFLLNVNKYDFGTKESTGETIGDVKLPPWANGDPTVFISKHKEALESPYVSQNLHAWIDLVFGFKQRGEAALESTNVFHYLSYQGARNLDTISDAFERRATIGIIHNFGQTPYQVFSRPHDRRRSGSPRSVSRKGNGEDLLKTLSRVSNVGSAVHEIVLRSSHPKILHCGPNQTLVPPVFESVLEWGFADNGVRFFSTSSGKLLGLYEQLHQDIILFARFADQSTLVTASRDCTLGVWSVAIKDSYIDMQPKTGLFGHRAPITAIAVSRAISSILSVDAEGAMILWDLNNCSMIRKSIVPHPVQFACLDDEVGHIFLCGPKSISIMSINGLNLVHHKFSDSSNDPITACAIQSSTVAGWFEGVSVLTGHMSGHVKIWSIVADSHTSWHMSFYTGLKDQFKSPITCIFLIKDQALIGDTNGEIMKLLL